MAENFNQEKRLTQNQEIKPGTCDVSVIICAYTEIRWNELCAAVESVRGQTCPPKEIILVIDHNPALCERARRQFLRETVIENQEGKGLSGARNSGIAIASGQVIAFMDEDAAAEPDWLERLLQGYSDPFVCGVGGAIQPHWLMQPPGWFPDEFNWVIGCTYKGMPEQPAPVRNLIGANMSFERKVFGAHGGFQSGLGRVGSLPMGCEETEFCIRVQQRRPGQKFLYEPDALVRHRVPGKRGTWRYFASRCFSEGISKAAVSRLVGGRDGLASERAYTWHTLPAGMLRGVLDGLRGHAAGFGRAAAILGGLVITGMGYMWGQLSNGRPFKRSKGSRFLPFFASELAKKGKKSERARILMVTPRFLPFMGGTENHVYQVARRLVRRNKEVTVLTADPTGRLPKYEVMDGIRVERVRAWPKNSDLCIAPGIYLSVLKGKWDLIHIQSYHTFVPPLAMLAARQSHIPYVVTFHGGGHSSSLRNASRRIQRAILGPLLRRAERLVAVANFEIKVYGRELGVPAERFCLIPNGSDLPKVQADPTRRQGVLIASVGRLERYKGHQRMIAAMPYILKERPDVRLWIAGSGPYEADLRELATKNGVVEQVKIQAIPMAERERMAAELSQAALFVLLSEFETHPIAVLEAISLGVPALVANTSGLSELSEQGLARGISLQSSSQEIANAVLEQLENPLIPSDVPFFTWDDCAQRLLELYEEIINHS
jgi:glycosyltransferase involved in cell wall biosynthesis/GT2 family glycosyltransferase